jgi:hypothetical protein
MWLVSIEEWNKGRLYRKKKEAQRNGLCVQCMKEPLVSGSRCSTCLEKHKIKGRQYVGKAKALGRCILCKDVPAKKGGSICDVCLERQNAAQKGRRQNASTKGICVACLRSPRDEGKATCGPCSEYRKQINVQYRKRKSQGSDVR